MAEKNINLINEFLELQNELLEFQFNYGNIPNYDKLIKDMTESIDSIRGSGDPEENLKLLNKWKDKINQILATANIQNPPTSGSVSEESEIVTIFQDLRQLLETIEKDMAKKMNKSADEIKSMTKHIKEYEKKITDLIYQDDFITAKKNLDEYSRLINNLKTWFSKNLGETYLTEKKSPSKDTINQLNAKFITLNRTFNNIFPIHNWERDDFSNFKSYKKGIMSHYKNLRDEALKSKDIESLKSIISNYEDEIGKLRSIVIEGDKKVEKNRKIQSPDVGVFETSILPSVEESEVEFPIGQSLTPNIIPLVEPSSSSTITSKPIQPPPQVRKPPTPKPMPQIPIPIPILKPSSPVITSKPIQPSPPPQVKKYPTPKPMPQIPISIPKPSSSTITSRPIQPLPSPPPQIKKHPTPSVPIQIEQIKNFPAPPKPISEENIKLRERLNKCETEYKNTETLREEIKDLKEELRKCKEFNDSTKEIKSIFDKILNKSLVISGYSYESDKIIHENIKDIISKINEALGALNINSTLKNFAKRVFNKCTTTLDKSTKGCDETTKSYFNNIVYKIKVNLVNTKIYLEEERRKLDIINSFQTQALYTNYIAYVSHVKDVYGRILMTVISNNDAIETIIVGKRDDKFPQYYPFIDMYDKMTIMFQKEKDKYTKFITSFEDIMTPLTIQSQNYFQPIFSQNMAIKARNMNDDTNIDNFFNEWENIIANIVYPTHNILNTDTTKMNSILQRCENYIMDFLYDSSVFWDDMREKYNSITKSIYPELYKELHSAELKEDLKKFEDSLKK